MIFANNIRFLRRKKKISQDELASKLGYKSFTTIQKWEDGTATPPYKVLSKLAELFDVDINDFMNIDLTKQLNSEVPILGVVRGGNPILANQEYLGFEHVYPDDAKHADCFYLEVVGDSMKDARILPGDLVYVHKQESLNNGDIGVVLINDEATIKQVFFKKDKMILQPHNDNYQPIVLTPDDIIEKNVSIIGKVLHNRIKF